MFNKTLHPGEDTTTVTRMSSSTTSFEMSFVIRLNSITFRASLTNPLLMVTMFSSEMFFDADKISQSMTRIMVKASGFRANIDSFLHLYVVVSFKKLPWNFVTSSMHLEILVSLKPLVTDLTYVSV
jgi:ABC-type multidrug transport system permease subunit